MNFALSVEEAALIAQFRQYLDQLEADGLRLPDCAVGSGDHPVSPAQLAFRKAFVRRLGADGWFGVSMPEHVGGQGRSSICQWLIMEELAYRHLPTLYTAVTIVANALLRVGSEDQRQRFVPPILAGEAEFCLGYTEPEAGTDLAALRTRARRDGDEYVVDGQKVFTTGAEHASHCWLAARTGPPDSLHRGISIFIVPMSAPGISVRPLITLADYRTNEVFFSGVRVAAADRVGEENQGWKIIAMALDFERTPQASGHLASFEELLVWTGSARGSDGTPLRSDPLVRAELAALAVRCEVARLFSVRMADMYARGEIPNVEASVAKIWHTELQQDLAGAALSIFGAVGQFSTGQDFAPARGAEEMRYRASAVQRISAGTNEVQRDIIAQRGLELPANRRRG